MRFTLSRTVKISLGLVLAALVVASVGYFFLVKPADADAATARDEAVELQQQLASLKAQLKALQGRQNAVPEFYRLSKAAPVNVDVTGVNLELLTLADRAGVSLDAFQTDDAPTQGDFAAPSFNLTLSGNFEEVAAYLRAIRNLVVVRANRVRALGNLYRVEEIEITKPDPALEALEVIVGLSITAPPEVADQDGAAVSPEDGGDASAEDGNGDAPEGDEAGESPDEGADG